MCVIILYAVQNWEVLERNSIIYPFYSFFKSQNQFLSKPIPYSRLHVQKDLEAIDVRDSWQAQWKFSRLVFDLVELGLT